MSTRCLSNGLDRKANGSRPLQFQSIHFTCVERSRTGPYPIKTFHFSSKHHSMAFQSIWSKRNTMKRRETTRPSLDFGLRSDLPVSAIDSRWILEHSPRHWHSQINLNKDEKKKISAPVASTASAKLVWRLSSANLISLQMKNWRSVINKAIDHHLRPLIRSASSRWITH